MKTLLFLAKGFETMEFSAFADVLGWAKYDFGYGVEFETCGIRKQIMGAFHIPVLVDKTIDEVDVDNYAALAIPGGFEVFGYYEDAYDERLSELIRKFNEKGKIVASICVGALPVGKSGVLENRKATTYHLDGGKYQNRLKEFGVNVINEPIVIDGNMITSYCPETAPHVAFKLLELLTSKEQMEIVKTAMGF